jgi:hypothetical protein
MKKVLVVVAVAGLFSFSSCKKDFTCTCTGGTGGNPAALTIADAKKADAETACSTYQTAQQLIYAGTKCSI